ncbi:MAG TPA: alpha/beta hydrolase [Tepidiformaceae bacterium]|jgi:acetyl esterase/lipase
MAVPEYGRVTTEEGVVFGTGGGRDLKVDIYTPPGNPISAPGVLLIHGGSWRSGDRSQLRGYGILLGRLGYVCVACEYRLSGEAAWPAQIHDAKAALRWMRANATRLGVDPGRIAVSGNSAGAHIALVLGGTPNLPEFEGTGGNPGVDTSVRAVISFYGPSDFGSDPEMAQGAVAELMGPGVTADALRGASPVSYTKPGYPPTLLIHGNGDETVDPEASLRVYRELAKAKVPVELHMYEGLPHAFDSSPIYGRQSADIMANFLARHLGAPVARPAAAAAG